VKDLLQKRWAQNALAIGATAAIAYSMVYIDVRARAKEAFRQGERYESWAQNPEEKKQFFEGKFLKEKAALDRRREKAEISQEDYDQDLEVLKFDRDQAVGESSIKYAYQWYKDTYELFSPPESASVRRARLLAPAMKERWREELRAKNIPFEEYMLDLEPGEDAGTLMVYSTNDSRDLGRCVGALREKGVEAKVYAWREHNRLKQEGDKIIVPRERFWEAHEIVKAAGAGR
jgi:hypothetical protein